ncbi:hypothetical protein [Simkania sp.]|uniref:hypothetical protein n=1 Tax=Simkania sp. TaxID=34094 RepID=UPI003B51AE4A
MSLTLSQGIGPSSSPVRTNHPSEGASGWKQIARAGACLTGLAAVIFGTVALVHWSFQTEDEPPKDCDSVIAHYSQDAPTTVLNSLGTVVSIAAHWFVAQQRPLDICQADESLTPDIDLSHFLSNQLHHVEASGFTADEVEEHTTTLQELLEPIDDYDAFIEELSHSYELSKGGETSESPTVNGFKLVGAGISKFVLTHPKLPGLVIKLPQDYKATLKSQEENPFVGPPINRKLLADFLSKAQIQDWLTDRKISRVKTPNMIYLQTSNGEYLLEEKIERLKKDAIAQRAPRLLSDSAYEVLPTDDFFRLQQQLSVRDMFPGTCSYIICCTPNQFNYENQRNYIIVLEKDNSGNEEPNIVIVDADERKWWAEMPQHVLEQIRERP